MPDSNKNPRGFATKRNIIIIAAAVLALSATGTAIAISAARSDSQSVSVLEIAQRYLAEQNYQQAVIEFQRILEIDPMNAEAYLGLAETYLGLGNAESAIAALQKGYEETGDAAILAKLNELTAITDQPAAEVGNAETAESAGQFTDEVLPAEDDTAQIYELVSIYTYNTNGSLSSFSYTDSNGNIATETYRNGTLTMLTTHCANRFGRQDNLLERIRLTPDEAGNYTVTMKWGYENGSIVYFQNDNVTTNYEYTYDENGNKISCLSKHEYSNGSTAVYESVFENTPDEKGRAVYTKQTSDGALLTEEYREYDPETGVLTKYRQENHEEGTFYEITYNSRGDVLSQISSFDEDCFEERYSYDADGNPITGETYFNGMLTETSVFEWRAL